MLGCSSLERNSTSLCAAPSLTHAHCHTAFVLFALLGSQPAVSPVSGRPSARCLCNEARRQTDNVRRPSWDVERRSVGRSVGRPGVYRVAECGHVGLIWSWCRGVFGCSGSVEVCLGAAQRRCNGGGSKYSRETCSLSGVVALSQQRDSRQCARPCAVQHSGFLDGQQLQITANTQKEQ